MEERKNNTPPGEQGRFVRRIHLRIRWTRCQESWIRSLYRRRWLGRQLEYKQSWAGGLVEYQSEAYSRQQCPACGYSSALNRKTQEGFRCVWPTWGTSGNADEVAGQNQLRRFLQQR
ncbi:MAG: hypothetical protein DMG40_00280 [Acidobacteria bacterium]|nr:MAG: hypothetical protein DMG40_00280 [Acidobacteriota bacterium]